MYASQKELASMYGYHRNTIGRMIQEMINSGRYPKSEIIGERKRRRVSVEAFEDYLINMDSLRNPIMKKYLKPYSRRTTNEQIR